MLVHHVANRLRWICISRAARILRRRADVATRSFAGHARRGAPKISLQTRQGRAMAQRKPRIGGAQINPAAVRGDMTAADLIDTAFLAYNGRRLREACRLFAEKMLEPDVIVGMSVTGALTPAGL